MDDITRLILKAREVLKDFHAALLSPGDWHTISGVLQGMTERAMVAEKTIALLEPIQDDPLQLVLHLDQLRREHMQWIPDTSEAPLRMLAQCAYLLAVRDAMGAVHGVLMAQKTFQCTLSHTSRRHQFEKVDATLIVRGCVVYLINESEEPGRGWRKVCDNPSIAMAWAERLAGRNVCPGADEFSRLRPAGETHADRMAEVKKS